MPAARPEARTIVFKDISDRKRIEAEREQILQREQTTREALNGQTKSKMSFLVLSHELRTPLNPILGWTCLLRNGNLDAGKTAQALETIELGAAQDLLASLRSARRSLTVVPVNLDMVILAALETLCLAAKSLQSDPFTHGRND